MLLLRQSAACIWMSVSLRDVGLPNFMEIVNVDLQSKTCQRSLFYNIAIYMVAVLRCVILDVCKLKDKRKEIATPVISSLSLTFIFKVKLMEFHYLQLLKKLLKLQLLKLKTSQLTCVSKSTWNIEVNEFQPNCTVIAKSSFSMANVLNITVLP